MDDPTAKRQDDCGFPETSTTMPTLFVGHGNPMNAIERNEFSDAWAEVGRAIPRPAAIVCVSAHWETTGTMVTAMERPRTIHDFGGFPESLYRIHYPAPGSPGLAALIRDRVRLTAVRADQTWGLDHGAWSVLCRMFPEATIPVVQLSLDRTRPPLYHYRLGKELGELRQRGILVIGSGNIVHNLGMIDWQGGGYDWASDFDQVIADRIDAGDHAAICDYPSLGRNAHLAIPTNEHFLPLLYILGLQRTGEPLRYFTRGITLGSLSMRSLWIG